MHLLSLSSLFVVGSFASALLSFIPVFAPPDSQPASPPSLPPIVTNDNRTAAGSLEAGVLRLELRAAVGVWRPQGTHGQALTVQAFGAGVDPLSVPGPLLRVPEGTHIEVTVRNELTEPLRVSGLCDRAASACPALDVPAGERRHVRFGSGPPGTYHYWATTTGMPLPFRAVDDTQLSGAFIVDPTAVVPGADRVLVITDWTSLTRGQLAEIMKQDDPGAAFLTLRPGVLFTINGLAWPHTERLRYGLGENVRWRVINLSTQVHPMHLHGFYFEVGALGNGQRDQVFPQGQRQRVVTQLLNPGGTMEMLWTPERAGNWLFHCHVMTHVSPSLHADGTSKSSDGHGGHDHQTMGMTGMVLGVTVEGPGWTETAAGNPDIPARRAMTLVMRSDPGRYGDRPAFGFVRRDAARSDDDHVPVPGPTLVLKRGEPVEITLVNQLPEATAIHWHGMELESYYDGVPGWSGAGTRITPMIEPGASFVVRFTPPQSGTFIYHTHLHDRVQLTSGLYGAMLVVDESETFDETTDHVVVIGRGGPQPDSPAVLNNERSLQQAWKAGTRHRVRLINITPDDIVSVSLLNGNDLVKWRRLTKDGAPVPSRVASEVAARQIIGVGETYDFEVETSPGRGTLWLEVRTTGGRWLTQGRMIVR